MVPRLSTEKLLTERHLIDTVQTKLSTYWPINCIPDHSVITDCNKTLCNPNIHQTKCLSDKMPVRQNACQTKCLSDKMLVSQMPVSQMPVSQMPVSQNAWQSKCLLQSDMTLTVNWSVNLRVQNLCHPNVHRPKCPSDKMPVNQNVCVSQLH